jgi:hypothetical protein
MSTYVELKPQSLLNNRVSNFKRFPFLHNSVFRAEEHWETLERLLGIDWMRLLLQIYFSSKSFCSENYCHQL